MRIDKAAELRLEQLLEEGFGQRIEPDQDGDYPLPGRGDFYARLETRQDAAPIVQVFAVAVRDVEGTQELFEAINDINANVAFSRCFWVLDQVLFETEIVADALKHASLGTAVSAVGSAASRFGPQITDRFGGHSLFADDAEPEGDDATGVGQYL